MDSGNLKVVLFGLFTVIAFSLLLLIILSLTSLRTIRRLRSFSRRDRKHDIYGIPHGRELHLGEGFTIGRRPYRDYLSYNPPSYLYLRHPLLA
jgi:hypothetical protein